MRDKPGKARWRPRFSLLGLMALVAVFAVATQGYLAWQRHAAQREVRWATAVFEEGAELQTAGESIVRTYCQSSERLCEAECRMPLADRKAATRAHLERIIYAQRKVIALEAIVLNGHGSDREFIEACRRRAEQMAAKLDPRSAATLAAWEKPIDVDFVDASLQDVLDHIGTTQGNKLRIEQVATPQWIAEPLTYSAKGVVMRQVLRDIERYFDLTFLVDEDSMIVRVY